MNIDDNAACRDKPTAWWFPADDERPDSRAIDVCNNCPVQDACLQRSLDEHEQYGTWAGRTPRELQALRRQQGIARRRRRRVGIVRTRVHLPPDSRHGTTHAYRQHGCRCDECTDASTLAHKQYRQRKAG